MGRRLFATLALIAALGLGTPNLMADQGHGKEKKHPHASKDDKASKEWQRRDGYEYRVYNRDERPPGWSRGNKTGWRDCGMPPGQAKKYGCWTYVNEGRRHYYYQDEKGRIIERRPVIEVHGSVDIHN